jgi:hypothetical protein
MVKLQLKCNILATDVLVWLDLIQKLKNPDRKMGFGLFHDLVGTLMA